MSFLKELTKEYIHKDPLVKTRNEFGIIVITQLFEAVETRPKILLSRVFLEIYNKKADIKDKKRVVCDYVASLTDTQAVEKWEQLYPYESRSFRPLY